MMIFVVIAALFIALILIQSYRQQLEDVLIFEEPLGIGDVAVVITEEARLPILTKVVIEREYDDEFYVRNIDSEYRCWIKKIGLAANKT